MQRRICQLTDANNRNYTTHQVLRMKNLMMKKKKKYVRTIVYLMDHFSISPVGYHELVQVEKSLSRAHLVESCSTFMDSHWDVKRTTETSPGESLAMQTIILSSCQDNTQFCYNVIHLIYILLSHKYFFCIFIFSYSSVIFSPFCIYIFTSALHTSLFKDCRLAIESLVILNF